MKAIRLMAVLTAMICGLVFAAPAHAEMDGWESKRESFRKKMEERMEGVLAQLGLSEEQKKLLDDNKKRHKEEAKGLRSSLKENMKAMEEELAKEPLDMAKIESIRSSSKQLRDKMMDERFESILEVRKILTKEQFLKFTALIKEQRQADKGNDGP